MLQVRDLTVRFGDNEIVDAVSFDVAAGEIACLLGPSGSGKSTLLRVIAGIEYPTAGQVFIDGKEVCGPRTFVEPEQRNVGMVFQDYALFPHLTVARNVAFGSASDPEANRALLARLGLEGFADSYPHRLSGGESQRVALARAMAPKPRILLLDEPFSALDSRLRDDVRRHTLGFIRESRTTTVIVTHDPEEAMRISDRIALLHAGRLVQFGTPAELYRRPSTLFAARFFSDLVAVPGECRQGLLETSLGAFPAAGFPSGARAVACIRPQHVRLASDSTSVAADVVSSEYCGDTHRVLVHVDGMDTPLMAHAHEAEMAVPENGARVYLEIDRSNVPVVPSETELTANPSADTVLIHRFKKETSYVQHRSS
jgi:iron(III) transport system ATP-binding protein